MSTIKLETASLVKVLLLTCASILGGCATAQPQGEWFTIGIANRASEPRLVEAKLTSSEIRLDVIKVPGAHFSYSRQDKLKVPETFTLRWRAEGDTSAKEAVFKVRSTLPMDVIEHLQSQARPVHSLSAEFRVVNGKAECLWSLARLDGGGLREIGGGGATRISEGVIRPQ